MACAETAEELYLPEHRPPDLCILDVWSMLEGALLCSIVNAGKSRSVNTKNGPVRENYNSVLKDEQVLLISIMSSAGFV